MGSLQEIQKKVTQAQEEIKQYNSEHVKHVIWPDIKDTLGQANDLARLARHNMGVIIYKRLDEKDLHGGIFTPIIVEQLKADPQVVEVPAIEPPKVFRWLPY